MCLRLIETRSVVGGESLGFSNGWGDGRRLRLVRESRDERDTDIKEARRERNGKKN